MANPLRLAMLLGGLALAPGLGGGGAVRAAERTFPIVDTGQEACYGTRRAPLPCPRPSDALFGQDAQYRGTQPHYRDNGDGTISDLVTGLMWTKAFTASVPWGEAARLASRDRTGGHGDWRIPTIKELYSLIQFTGETPGPRGATPKPYLDRSIFAFEYPSGQTMRSIDAQYITSTLYTGRVMRNQRAFFGVNFADGRIKGYPTTGPKRRGWYLRLVRGSSPYGPYGVNAFRDNGDGTIADDATGLTWTRADSGDSTLRTAAPGGVKGDGALDWGEALAFCEGLSFAGQTDWRLPNAKELQGIVDYGRSPQATNSPAIDPIFQTTAIVAEQGRRDFPAFWTSTTHLDGPEGTAVVIHFGEALGSMRDGLPGGGGTGPGGGVNGPPGGGSNGGNGIGQPPFGRPPPGGPAGFPPPRRNFQGRLSPSPDSASPLAPFGGPGFPGPSDPSRLMDVHGAGAQRSDPKTGEPSDYPKWDQGPQGDVRRVFNYARCVRGGL